MQELRELDQVAYIRFASVYHSFEDLQAFQDIINIIEKDLTPEMIKTQLKLIDEENIAVKKMKSDKNFMEHAIELAKKGIYTTSPNPSVDVLSQKNKILSMAISFKIWIRSCRSYSTKKIKKES